MRTVTAKSVIERGLQKCGHDPASVPTATLLAAGAYLDEIVRAGWEWTDWPELCVTEERPVRQIYDDNFEYHPGDEMYYPNTGKYYRANADTEGDPPPFGEAWDEAADIEPYMLLATRGATEIGRVLDIRTRDFRNDPSAPLVHWRDEGDRIWLISTESPGLLWFRYRLPAPRFTRVEYGNATAYAAGDVVYYPTTGECYVALAATTGNVPTNPTYWRKQDLPLVLSAYASTALAAALQEDDGQFEKGAALRARSGAMLEDEQDKFIIQTRAIRG